jgi:hypothetical protein
VVFCVESSLDDALAAGGTHEVYPCTSSPFELVITTTKVVSIDTTLELAGAAGEVLLRMTGSGPIFSVDPGVTLELRGLSLAGGTNSNVENEGTLIFRDGRILDGSGVQGGGIRNLGSLVLERATVENNQASEAGGGLHLAPGSTATIRASLFAGNSTVALGGASTRPGGAIASDGTLAVENTTFSGNVALDDGGALWLGGGSATIDFATFSGNVADGAGSALAGPVAPQLSGTLIDGSCASPVLSAGHNLESPGNCCGLTAASDLAGVPSGALALSSLSARGGRTETHALDEGSIAIDRIPAADCPPADQRGAPRPDLSGGAACDVGAFESTRIGLANVQKRVASGDPDPRAGSVLDRFEMTAYTQGQIAFVAVDSLGERSLYLHDGASLSHVAGASTPVPGAAGTFVFPSADYTSSPIALAYPLRLEAHGGEFAFAYELDRVSNPTPPPASVWPDEVGIYRFSATQPITRCVGAGDPLPGGGTYLGSGQPQTEALDLYDGSVYFADRALYRCDEAGIELLLPTSLVRPNGDLVLHSLLPGGSLESKAGGLLVSGSRRIRPSGGTTTDLDAGIYAFDPALGELELRSTLSPSGGERSAIHLHAGRVMLGEAARFVSGSFQDGAVQVDDAGAISELGVVPIARGGTFTFRDGVAWLSGRGSEQIGLTPNPIECTEAHPIASTLGGLLEPHLQIGDAFDGGVVTCVLGGSDFADGPEIAFVAYLDDGSSAVYTATVPEPGGGWALGLLGLALLARRATARPCAPRIA